MPEAIARSSEIASAISLFSLEDLRYSYPHEICPKGKTPQEYLSELTWSYANRLYLNGIPQKIEKQLNHELKLIEELSYAKYFLTVYDIVSFAKKQKILFQGRGAAANSVICFILGITTVNPSEINLLFERFISKERSEPPDIDVDFEHERREEVIQHIYNKYGRQRAALASAIITYRTKSAVRDVGKVFNLSEEKIKLIQKTKARENPPYTADILRKRGLNPESRAIKLTLELSSILKGFPRHLTQHVGGFVISEEALSNIVPIEKAAMPNRSVIEWDKNDINEMGMLKIDILALGMLTCIRKALELVNTNYNKNLSLRNLPAEDPKVYNMISAADTIGVFQIESRAQMSMLPRLKPKCFYDLVIQVAIVRPGPIQGGMVHPYLRRRKGIEPVTYPSKEVEKILSSTLGVPIFQEQVMQLVIDAAGFSAGEADELRRAMGSWKLDENSLAKFEDQILNGMRKKGYSISFAKQIFQQILGFGQYGFPQSHAASFARLVYASCWLKYYYPAEFCAALLNSQPMGFYRPAQLIEDAKQHQVSVLPVDVVNSSWDNTIVFTKGFRSKPAIRLGMRCIKGLPFREAQKLIEGRALSDTNSTNRLKDLWHVTKVSVTALKKLAKADAFRSLSLDRQQALWQISKLRDKKLPLLDYLEDRKSLEPENVSLPKFSDKAHVVQDFKTTGFSLKSHPIHFIRPRLSEKGVRLNSELKTHRD
ncbi:UNVERIFIED_CONTAM: hypothetical protein GTU68_047845, partial [Idotea baltica]|nr:hypothetical protein [Idotea baltica]